jgi:hypothetical protein
VSELVLFNTATRRKERFESLEPGHARVYTCGPTVYAAQHIGNLRSQLFADLVRRTLEYEGYRVTHVINVTDVGHLTDDADSGEDKMELAARRAGRRAEDIAREYTEQWLRDRERVGCLAPTVLCKASEHIAEQIALAERLEARGSISIPVASRATPTSPGSNWKRSAAGRGSGTPRASATQPTSPSGSSPARASAGSRNGIRRGAGVSRAGISSARR